MCNSKECHLFIDFMLEPIKLAWFQPPVVPLCHYLLVTHCHNTRIYLHVFIQKITLICIDMDMHL